MIRFTDIVQDQGDNALPGALITVRTYPDGSLAAITDDSGAVIPNSIIAADTNGAYAFHANPGLYALEFRLLPYEQARKTKLITLADDLAGVDPSNFGAVGNYNTTSGTGTDDTPAFTAAITSLGATGGVIRLQLGNKYLIDTNLTIPDNVTIEYDGDGRWGKYNTSEAILLNWAPALYVNPAATITIGSSAGFRNVPILRKGLQFNISSATVASTFLGTAVTIADFATDPIVEACTILGFQYGVRTLPSNNRADRCRISRNNIDCLFGIFLENASDLSYIINNEGWPFVTVGSTGEANSAQLIRSGTFIHIGGTINDWSTASGNFCYGYHFGYRATDNVASVEFVDCAADHVPGLSDGAIGFLVDGTAHEIKITNPRAAGKQYGIEVNSTYGSGTRLAALISNPMVWSTTTAAIICNAGDMNVDGGYIRGGASGIKSTATAGWVHVDGTDIRGFTTALDNFSSSIRFQHRNCKFSSNTTNFANPYVATIAAAATLVPDCENEVFVVTGTTTVTAIQHAATYASKRISLQFAASLTVTNGASLKLAGAANFSATADDILTLASDGSVWREVGRSVN